jgi:hypothetical protein
MVMVELSEFQIDIVSAYIRNNGVAQEELHEDLLDHVCTSIENRLRQGDSFEYAFQHTIKLFGPGGLVQVQQDTFELLTEINTTMKKVTFGFGLTSTFLLLAGTIFKLQHWPGSGVMVTIGAALLVLVYFPLILFYKLKESPGKEALLHITGFLGLTLTTLGVLFKIMHWPGAAVLLLGGMSVLAVAYVPIYFYKKYQTSVNKPITLSASLVAMTCLILVFALMQVNTSSNYNHGITLIDAQLRESLASVSNNGALYSKLGNNRQSNRLKHLSDSTIHYLEQLKLAIISANEGISTESASQLDLADMQTKDNYDVPTHMIIASSVESPYHHQHIEAIVNLFRSEVIAVYPLEMQSDMSAMFPYDTGIKYTKNGETEDWVHHNFNQIPSLGVVSFISKLQSDIRQAENQALVYLLSQPEASNPPS